MNKLVSVGLLFLAGTLAVPLTASTASATTTLKLGTLAPRSSSWMAIFVRAAREIKEATGGEVIFKIYPGGRQGDEKVMVGKMKTGQLHAAAITAVGLGEIHKPILVLQAPGLFSSYAKLDKARTELQPGWAAAMQAKGFVLLGWGDTGGTSFHSNRPIAVPAALTAEAGDLGKPKVWIWNSDPIARSVARMANITGVPASLPDVVPGLTSGSMNTLFASPLVCLQLTWCDHLNSRTDRVFTYGIGALVLTKKGLEMVPEAHRQAVLTIWEKWTKALVKKIRIDNGKARRILAKKKGVAPIPVSNTGAWDALAKKVQNDLVGKIYSKELLKKVKQLAK